MSSCSDAATATCRDGLTASLLSKEEVAVLVPVEEERPPVLMCKPSGRLVKVVKEACAVSLSVTFPMVPSMLAASAGEEAWSILALVMPMILTGLLLYLWSMISMLFLGRLGGLALAGGSLAIGFANITGYSVLSGLSMGMDPICGQAFGAGHYELLGVTMQRTVLLLFAASLPIAGLWMHMWPLLLHLPFHMRLWDWARGWSARGLTKRGRERENEGLIGTPTTTTGTV